MMRSMISAALTVICPRRVFGDSRPRANLPQRPGAADRADLARRRDRHHGAHRRAAAHRAAQPDRDRRQPPRRQQLDRRTGGGALARRRTDAAGHLGRHHHRQPLFVEQAALQRQGVHADHGAVPRHAGAGCQRLGAGEQRAGADRARQGQARNAELRLLRRRHLCASQHGGLQAAHRRPTSCTFRIAARRRPRHALLAGDVNMLLLNLSSIEAHEKTGKVRILASAGAKRAQARPDLPTIAEAGVPGFSTTRVVRAARSGEHAAGAGGENSRRCQQGARPAADRRSFSRRTASSA